jgi:hypothetical protein
MPNYYGFVNPGLTGGFGASRGRWALSLHYQNYFAQSKSNVINPETGVQLAKRGVSRQNAMIKLSYALWQAKIKQ